MNAPVAATQPGARTRRPHRSWRRWATATTCPPGLIPSSIARWNLMAGGYSFGSQRSSWLDIGSGSCRAGGCGSGNALRSAASLYGSGKGLGRRAKMCGSARASASGSANRRCLARAGEQAARPARHTRMSLCDVGALSAGVCGLERRRS